MKNKSIVILLSILILSSCGSLMIKFADSEKSSFKIKHGTKLLMLCEYVKADEEWTINYISDQEMYDKMCNILTNHFNQIEIPSQKLIYSETDLLSKEKIEEINQSFEPNLMLKFKTINYKDRFDQFDRAEVTVEAELYDLNHTYWKTSFDTNGLDHYGSIRSGDGEDVATKLIEKMKSEGIL